MDQFNTDERLWKKLEPRRRLRRKLLRGASKKMLTDSLRGLERDGFVERNVYAEVPVRVEYSLTALGWSATELLMALADWADEHLADVEQARLRYRNDSMFGNVPPADFAAEAA